MGWLAGRRIFVAGHRGLAGGAVMRALSREGHVDVLLRGRAQLDLEDAAATRRFFEQARPQAVFLCAAKVGGIAANNARPADFLFRNLAIQQSVIAAAADTGVERLIFLGSSCIYPRDCPQPIREDYLLGGPLEPTNRPYALAKIAGIEMCWALNRQSGCRYLAAMPTNLYGPGDTYDAENSHVLPALIMKMHAARLNGDKDVVLWGTGKPRREFLHCDDLARALVALADLSDERFLPLVHPTACPIINVGCGEDISIAELARLVAGAVGYGGGFRHDTARPDGTPRKLLDVSRLFALGWRPTISLAEGIAGAYADYLARQPTRPAVSAAVGA